MDAEEQLLALASVLAVLERHGIESWLFGGWAVDFHLGVVTRAHADLDLAVWATDVPTIGALLARAGWSHAPQEGEDGYTGYARDGVLLELAFLARDESGRVSTPVRDGVALWPADAFGEEVAALSGVRARVIGRRALREEKGVIHPDPQVAAKDRADRAALDEAGLPG
jgi:hypothetical protein